MNTRDLIKTDDGIFELSTLRFQAVDNFQMPAGYGWGPREGDGYSYLYPFDVLAKVSVTKITARTPERVRELARWIVNNSEDAGEVHTGSAGHRRP